MEKVLTAILAQLDQMTIQGKEAERMAAIKAMVRDVREAFLTAQETKKEEPEQ